MSTSTPSMLPLQTAPIDRTPAGAAAFSSETGAEASFDWGSLIPVATGLAGALGF